MSGIDAIIVIPAANVAIPAELVANETLLEICVSQLKVFLIFPYFLDSWGIPFITGKIEIQCIQFFQGLEDKVVPPNQAEVLVAALREKEVPVAYVPFAGERHGFRQAANIKRALEAELYFYSRVFTFDLPDTIEPVVIVNLP